MGSGSPQWSNYDGPPQQLMGPRCSRPCAQCGRECSFEINSATGQHGNGLRYCLCQKCEEKFKTLQNPTGMNACPQPLSYLPPGPMQQWSDRDESQLDRVYARLRAVDQKEVPSFDGNPEDTKDYLKKLELFEMIDGGDRNIGRSGS